MITEQVAREEVAMFLCQTGEFCGEFEAILRITTEMWLGFDKGKFICAWGLAPRSISSDKAYLWAHVTSDFTGSEFTFIRQSQIEIEKMLKLYPIIIGHVERNNRKAKRWLRWLGAKFGEGEHLIPFTIEANNG